MPADSLMEALTAWMLMIERRIARIERALRLPPEQEDAGKSA